MTLSWIEDVILPSWNSNSIRIGSKMSVVMNAAICEAENAMSTFTSIPVLDLSLINSPTSKPDFLVRLRQALVHTGFFYIENTTQWVPASVQSEFVQKAIDLCNLPVERKLEIDMINSKHFLGYSRMGCERTAAKTDYREMFDVSRGVLLAVHLISRRCLTRIVPHPTESPGTG